ncbi:hypothetical protein RHMOL_Rhmol11G0006800 [Rhododendron molle]|uniref:Uncharacterized protein n=1 Tax=Rhododendron molle TaxID=49168 RepID=A0ACC0LMK6_RHOML|nr:hypothetical protein RHMOL_Rhmol11G0006800 [Rhododendron molle]
MRDTPPKQSLNYSSSADLPSPCLSSLGSQTNKTKLLSGRTRLYHHKERMVNQTPPGILEDKSYSAIIRISNQ